MKTFMHCPPNRVQATTAPKQTANWIGPTK